LRDCRVQRKSTVKTLAIGKYRVLLDDEDFDKFSSLSWCVSSSRSGVYAQRYVGGGRKNPKHIRLHVELMKPPKGMLVDHLNGDTLDNRRSNLRVCTPSQNLANVKVARKHNRLGVLGVRETPGGKFQATIVLNRRQIYIGTFSTPKKANKAYWAKRIELRGI
jgi:hypothetical protein